MYIIAVKTKRFLDWILKDNTPFDIVHVAYLELYLKAHHKYKYILLLTYNKFVKIFPIKTNEVIKHLQNYFRVYSRPICIISDRLSTFTFTAFYDFIKKKII